MSPPRELAARKRHVRGTQGTPNFQGTQVVGFQPIRVQFHSDGPWLPTHNISPRNLQNAGQPLRDILADTPQRIAIGPRECQSHDRDVVDFDRLDHPTLDTRRDDVQILVDLLEELDQAALAILSHVKAYRDDGLVLLGHAIHMF